MRYLAKMKPGVTHMENTNLLNGTVTKDEYGDFYAGYIQLSRGENLFKQLEQGRERMSNLLQMLDDKQALYRYEENKWSVKEMIGHMIDTERIMTYRALSFARNEQTALPGFEQDEYVAAAEFDHLPVDQFHSDYLLVRASTLSLFQSFTPEMLMRKGVASGSRCSVRALGFIIAGHEIHHFNILKERYLPEL